MEEIGRGATTPPLSPDEIPNEAHLANDMEETHANEDEMDRGATTPPLPPDISSNEAHLANVREGIHADEEEVDRGATAPPLPLDEGNGPTSPPDEFEGSPFVRAFTPDEKEMESTQMDPAMEWFHEEERETVPPIRPSISKESSVPGP